MQGQTISATTGDSMRRGLLLLSLTLLMLASAAGLLAEEAFYETEPNNTPLEANPVSGEVTLFGTMTGRDQDGFLWTVSDNDARKRWTFQLQGIPGALTIVEVMRVHYAENGSDVERIERLMKMGSRDGLTPSIAADLMFEPGEYLIGLAQAGSSDAVADVGGGAFRPPTGSLSFGESGQAEPSDPALAAADDQAGAYRFYIREGSRLSVDANPGPRESRDRAQVMRAGREFASFETREKIWFAFNFDPADLSQRWDIEAQVPVGRELEAKLIGEGGQSLAEARVSDRGILTFPDLSPGQESYYLELTAKAPNLVQAVRSVAVGQRVSGEEAEPNDKWELANRVDLSQSLRGRIGKDGETDFFLFEIDEATADQLLALHIESKEPGQDMEFCLLTAARKAAKCVRDKTPIELGGLVLQPGPWGLSVSRAKQGVEYSIGLSGQGSIQADTEAEPNDHVEFASGVPANNRIKGSIRGEEDDYFRFTVADEPQLWRFQVIGEGLGEIAYHDAAGKQRARIRPDAGQNRARLENLFLLPGTHFIRVSGSSDADYTLLARPLGPPDPNGEREPNDDTLLMQRLAVGQVRTGLLADRDDRDFYRFFLANWDHVRLTVQPPADALIKPQLFWQDVALADGQPREAGRPLTIQGLFPPGDYHISLESREPSEAEYSLSLERLPRFGCPADCEPSGVKELYLASPLPPGLVLEGVSGEWRDLDTYALPQAEAPYGLTIRSDAPPQELAIGRHWADKEILRVDADAGSYSATVPAGGPYQLIVDSRGAPYRMELEFDSSPAPLPAGATLPVSLDMSLEADTVSAYRPVGQRVSGSVELNNTGPEPLELELEAATSDYRWGVALQRTALTLAAGASASVPFELRVPTDAWAERPVRLSVAVRDGAGAQVEGWGEIAVSRDAAPMRPHFGWSVPDRLLGGLNAAWDPMGGSWAEEAPRARRSDTLRDAIVFEGARLDCCGVNGGWGTDYPTMTLELPGGREHPVAGIALNHWGSSTPYRNVRKATLLLSLDGQVFEEVLSFETLPVDTEQFFTLPEPIPARFARLRIEETFHYLSGTQGVNLGEWKVVLQPGYDLSGGMGYNLADPVLGGHLVWDTPAEFYSPNGILEEGKNTGDIATRRIERYEYAIGFHQNRAARIQRVEWVNPEGLQPDKALAKVQVAVSTESPVGPWTPIGDLQPASGAAPAVLELERPLWARFVRFTGIAPAGARAVSPPSVIRIREQPSGLDYRSILGEWGYGDHRGPFELERGLPPEAELKVADHISRERAADLPPGRLAEGEVLLTQVEHWYRLQVPTADNSLRIELAGQPTVRTRLELQDAAGQPVVAQFLKRESTPASHLYEAVVEPGAAVWLRVFEPPRNVIFSWDTSASISAYLPTIYNALAAFAGQVVPGQEAVNLAPFGRSLLLRDWFGEPYVLQTVLNDYPRKERSSSAEQTLSDAAKAMEALPGTKAIVVIHDGITVHHGPMWDQMKSVQPRIFSVHVGGNEAWNIDVMEDWARVNGGDYRQLVYQGEMEVAFDRAATLMRRPAGYSLRVDSEFREAPGPGRLSVLAGEGGTAQVVGGAAVELILDASGSMLQRMEGKRRIVVAKEVLTEAVRQHIPAGTPMALRVFGHKEPDACRSDLEIPLAPLNPEAAAAAIAGIQAMNLARTPIAASLAAVESDLKGAGGRAAIVLVTDGEETCDGDPAAVIEALQEKGIEVNLNIVGFAIGDPGLEAQFESWAGLGGGRYFPAQDQQGLSEALREALRVPFIVRDAAGAEVARGAVGGDPVELERGLYRVEVPGSPARVFEQVEIAGEDSVIVRIE